MISRESSARNSKYRAPRGYEDRGYEPRTVSVWVWHPAISRNQQQQYDTSTRATDQRGFHLSRSSIVSVSIDSPLSLHTGT